MEDVQRQQRKRRTGACDENRVHDRISFVYVEQKRPKIIRDGVPSVGVVSGHEVGRHNVCRRTFNNQLDTRYYYIPGSVHYILRKQGHCRNMPVTSFMKLRELGLYYD